MYYIQANLYRGETLVYRELWDDLQPMTETEVENFISKCSEFNIRGITRILVPVRINSSFSRRALSIKDPHDAAAMKIRRRSWNLL